MAELILGVWHCQGMVAPDVPVRQGSLRTHNLGLVLRQVAGRPVPVSRADVAAATGLTKATVSTLVDELLAGSLLTEVAPPSRTRAGRPATGLRLAADGPAGLGLEVNVDYLAGCLVDLTGAVRRHEVRPADQRGRPLEAVLDDLAALARKLIAGAAQPIGGAALAVPGLVADGVVRLAPNLGWRDVDVQAEMLGRLGELRPFTVDNEANLAALGELAQLAQPRPSFLYVSGEIGVGAGIVLDGQLFRGGRGFGGELGHVTIRPDGPVCRCGSRGCLEVYANQEALLRDSGAADVAHLVALAKAGAPAGVMALDRAGQNLGVAVATVVNLFDLRTVVLGGIYAPLAPWLASAVSGEIADRVLTAAWAPVLVRASALDSAATVIGAAGSVVRLIHDAPASWLSGKSE